MALDIAPDPSKLLELHGLLELPQVRAPEIGQSVPRNSTLGLVLGTRDTGRARGTRGCWKIPVGGSEWRGGRWKAELGTLSLA